MEDGTIFLEPRVKRRGRLYLSRDRERGGRGEFMRPVTLLRTRRMTLRFLRNRHFRRVSWRNTILWRVLDLRRGGTRLKLSLFTPWARMLLLLLTRNAYNMLRLSGKPISLRKLCLLKPSSKESKLPQETASLKACSRGEWKEQKTKLLNTRTFSAWG